MTSTDYCEYCGQLITPDNDEAGFDAEGNAYCCDPCRDEVEEAIWAAHADYFDCPTYYEEYEL